MASNILPEKAIPNLFEEKQIDSFISELFNDQVDKQFFKDFAFNLFEGKNEKHAREFYEMKGEKQVEIFKKMCEQSGYEVVVYKPGEEKFNT